MDHPAEKSLVFAINCNECPNYDVVQLEFRTVCSSIKGQVAYKRVVFMFFFNIFKQCYFDV